MRIAKFMSSLSGLLWVSWLLLAGPASASIVLTTQTLPAATQNQAYSFTLSSLGGNTPYGYLFTGGVLPNGLTISPGGVISGTPTLAGTFNFTVLVQDSSTPKLSAQFSLTLLVNNNSNLQVATSALPDGQVNQGYTVALAATGGSPPYSWDLSSGSGNLPNGLTIAGGNILGTPNVTGTFNFLLRVSDQSGASAVRNLSLRVNGSGLAIQTSSLPNASLGVLYSQSIQITGGAQPYTSSISAGSLPSGLSFASGVISGTPTAIGSSTFTISVVDALNTQVQRVLTLNVTPPAFGFSSTTLPAGQINVAYSATLGAVGGISPFTYSILAGTLPSGITFTNGVFTGTPTSSGSFPLTIQVRDSASPNATVSANFNLVINSTTLLLSSAALPSAVINNAYSTQIGASGGQPPYTFTVIAGSPAPGLSLSTAGVLSGTPTASGSYQFTVRLQDSLGATTQGLITVTVNTSSLILNSTALPSGQVNVPYSGTLTAAGGTAPYTFTLIGGALPQGLTLGANGLVSGTPAVAGTFQVTFRVQDAQGNAAQSSISISINAFGLRITTLAMPSARQGQPYSASILAEGGVTPYTFIITGGQLPPGLNLNFNGLVSGTPTQLVNLSFTVRVIDSAGANDQVNLAISVNGNNLSLTNSSVPPGQLNTAYSQALVATGGTSPYTYNVTSGALPPGISVSSSGQLAGTPTASGTFPFRISVTDSTGAAASFHLVLVIAASQLGITTNSLGAATVGVSYSQILSATGGTAPYSFTINGGALPNGLTLLANGTLSGTPTLNGSFSFTVRVTDSQGAVATANFSLNVAATSVLTIVTSTMPDAQLNVPYSVALNVSGGVSPYQFSIIGGGLPPGLSLTGTGLISGTATAGGAYSFLVRVVDGFGAATQQSLTITVNTSGIAITTSAIPNGQLGQFFTTQFSASGGQQPYTWSLVSGSLPSGVTLQANGILSGLPTTGGGFQVTIRVTDAAGLFTARTFGFTIGSTVLSFLSSSLPQGFINQPYNAQLQVGGGAAPYTITIVSGTLPLGLIITQLGQITGTPTATSFTALTFRVTDATGATAQVTLNLAIGQNTVQISTANLPNAAIGQNYNAALLATGGTSPYTWTVINGLLPAGLQLSAAGVIAGTATTAGIASFTVRVTDASGATATQNYNISVLASSLLITTASLPPGRVNQPYLQTIQTAGGVLPLRFEIVSTIVAGQPPPGLTLSLGGTLSGTPQTTGSFTFSIRVSDAQNLVTQATYTLVISAAAPSITTTTLGTGTVGTPYSQAISATGGTPPYTFSLVTGTAPGLNLSPAGILSGIPNTVGNFTITIRVSDAIQATSDATFTVSIASGVGPLSVNAVAPPGGVLYFPYSLRLAASGGREPYSWSVSSGPLPNGLRLDNSGGLAGQLLAPGTYRFTARVTDSLGTTAETPLGITVADAARLESATVGVAYNATVPNPATGRAPFSYALNSNALGAPPQGLVLSADGRLSGTPQNAGEHTFGLLARDANGIAQNVAVTIQVLPASGLRILTSSVPGGATGAAYSQSLTAAGGTEPYNWVVSSGSLPNGLNLNPLNGQITGTPSIQGTNFFVARVQDAAGATATTYFALSVGVAGAPILTAVTSAASYAANAVAPGELLTIFGGTLGPQTLVSFSLDNGLVPAQLSGTRVFFDGVAAPLLYTQSGQVGVIAPFGLEGRAATRMVLEYLGFQSTPFVLPVAVSKPGVFSFDGSGEGPGAILNQNGSVNTGNNRAERESVVVLYLTGAGAMNPAGLEGRVASGASSLNLPVAVSVNGAPATVLYAGNAPGLVEGVVQMNIRLPAATTPGQNPIRVQVGANATTTNVTVWVQ
ncbi:MAG: putative Ig domain-containing protein [Acidobacteriota bacterium]